MAAWNFDGSACMPIGRAKMNLVDKKYETQAIEGTISSRAY